MNRKKHQSGIVPDSGFTLVEVLIALAIAVAMAMLVSSGTIQSLKTQSAALYKLEASLLLKRIELAHQRGEESQSVQKEMPDWAMLSNRIEDGDDLWEIWQISPKDRRSATWSVFFSADQDEPE